MATPFKMKGSPFQRNFGISPVKNLGSSQEVTKGKKKDEKVVDSDTSEVRDVGTQRLIDAGAPKEVIQKSKDRFIEKYKKSKQKK